jgi:hypothetical protein
MYWRSSHLSQVSQLHVCYTSKSQLVASVASWLQSVVNVVESCYHNDDTKEALETSHVLGLKEENWFTGVKHLLTPKRAS